MSISKIQYKGIEVLYVDYSPCDGTEAMIEQLHQSADAIRDYPDKSAYTLINVAGASSSREFMNESKKLSTEVYTKKAKARAIIGIDPIKKVLLTAYNVYNKQNKIVPVNTKEEGLEYLYNQSLAS